MPEFRENIPGGSADKGENPIPPLLLQSESKVRFVL